MHALIFMASLAAALSKAPDLASAVNSAPKCDLK